MAKKPQTYWQKRFELYEKRANLKSEAHIKSLAKEYEVAKKAMERDLAVFYNRLAKNNELPDIQAAKKLLEADELKDFHMSLEEYTKLAKENGISGDFTQQLENASLKHRISRLEAMKVQLDAEASILMAKEAKGLEKFTASAYESAYYNGAFEIAKGTGVGKSLFRIDKRKINTVIHKPWAADGRNFSERVWGQHRPQLINNLHRELTSSIMRGTGPDEAIKNIAHQFDVSLSSAARLVQTEEAYFSSVAQKDVFKDLDVEQYEIIATLDSHTSDICQGLDGKVFKMSEFEAGVTAPPFHVRCRTTTAPYFEDEAEGSTRAARNEETGKTEQVPANVKYEDWEKGYLKDPKTGKTAAEIEAEAKEKAASVADEKAKAAASIKAQKEAEAEAQAKAASPREMPVEKAIQQITESGKYNNLISASEYDTPARIVDMESEYWETREKIRYFDWTEANDKEYKKLIAQEKKTREYLNRYYETYQNETLEQLALQDHMEVKAVEIYDPGKTLPEQAKIVKAIKPSVQETHERIVKMFSPEYKQNTWRPLEMAVNPNFSRANYVPGTHHINLTAKEEMVTETITKNSSAPKPKKTWRVDIGSQAHETAHALEEANPHISERCREFLEYRTKNSPEVSLNEIWLNNPQNTPFKIHYPNGPYDTWETTKPDNFFSPYCGKQYTDGGTEIFSMGVQRVVEDPRKFQKEDPEYFNFIVGLMRGEI